ncbi:MAG: hypothetical protein H8E40_09810 [Chloroflexi bacterium]|nr:hypothetical protein [Chloroflexota bacterium]MBL7164975.1 hypothetical protein [Dehalococcoidales bacterium]
MMHLPLRPNANFKKLPKPISDEIRRRFRMLPEYLDTLRCFEFTGTVNGKQVKRIRIFSPILVKQQNITITDLSDLEKHPNMLLFEGYIDREGETYVADRRSPPHIVKKNTIDTRLLEQKTE